MAKLDSDLLSALHTPRSLMMWMTTPQVTEALAVPVLRRFATRQTLATSTTSKPLRRCCGALRIRNSA
ncbi:hypothetical protein [Paraburkholderia sacchari]|uniref:hypothetical protein n=1 Tax=Paraburkholderia sacchari TaxID=159450 RepID=UPI000541F525|nr:hypothetical protein [Paraburkholderia sacchari]NLP60113.1 hypothetical protein [Paraburkholderia sacchari]